MLKTVTEHMPNVNITVNIITDEDKNKSVNTEVKKSAVEAHVHDCCEIYINISGNVSFMVEKNIYSIKSGDVIITRPYEYHYCINHSDEKHNHICIYFSCDEDKSFYRAFFERKIGEDNHISLPDLQKDKLIALCNSITDSKDKVKKIISFFSLIELISDKENVKNVSELPEDVVICMDYINKNLQKNITISELSEVSFVTINTLERHFKKFVGISPYSYIQNCRLACAAAALEAGATVSQAAEVCGFGDYSHFIAVFKRRYGKTPFKFKNNL